MKLFKYRDSIKMLRDWLWKQGVRPDDHEDVIQDCFLIIHNSKSSKLSCNASLSEEDPLYPDWVIGNAIKWAYLKYMKKLAVNPLFNSCQIETIVAVNPLFNAVEESHGSWEYKNQTHVRDDSATAEIFLMLQLEEALNPKGADLIHRTKECRRDLARLLLGLDSATPQRHRKAKVYLKRCLSNAG